MNSATEEDVNVAEVLAQIKMGIRQQRLKRTTDEEFNPDVIPSLSEILRGPDSTWSLSEKPTVADMRILGHMASWPVIGPLLAFLRELYGGLWTMTRRRTPWGQQVRFNAEVNDTLRRLVWHMEMIEELIIEHDRMLVDFNRRLFAAEQKLVALLTSKGPSDEQDAGEITHNDC